MSRKKKRYPQTAATRWLKKAKVPYVTQLLKKEPFPIVATSDYMKTVPDQIAPYVGRTYRTLGTDGWGRSDGRDKLRQFFEVHRNNVCVSALSALADEGAVDRDHVTRAIKKYGLDTEQAAPRHR